MNSDNLILHRNLGLPFGLRLLVAGEVWASDFDHAVLNVLDRQQVAHGDTFILDSSR